MREGGGLQLQFGGYCASGRYAAFYRALYSLPINFYYSPSYFPQKLFCILYVQSMRYERPRAARRGRRPLRRPLRRR